ncbi:MAG: EAL domain-containing protein, partial [Pseudonocardiaceae bacterium]
LVDLPHETRRAMDELVARGVRFAVDDFGTGYSSLARLKELPAQIIKLDRRFVSGVGVDPSDVAVVRAVVDMARAMGRTCVAEGVETETQFQVLRGLGVDAYQGWLFSRAIPAPEFRESLLH